MCCFYFFPNSALRNRGAAYPRTFTVFQNGHLNTFQKLNKNIHKFPLPQISEGNGHKIVKKKLLLTVINIIMGI